MPGLSRTPPRNTEENGGAEMHDLSTNVQNFKIVTPPPVQPLLDNSSPETTPADGKKGDDGANGNGKEPAVDGSDKGTAAIGEDNETAAIGGATEAASFLPKKWKDENGKTYHIPKLQGNGNDRGGRGNDRGGGSTDRGGRGNDRGGRGNDRGGRGNDRGGSVNDRGGRGNDRGGRGRGRRGGSADAAGRGGRDDSRFRMRGGYGGERSSSAARGGYGWEREEGRRKGQNTSDATRFKDGSSKRVKVDSSEGIQLVLQKTGGGKVGQLSTEEQVNIARDFLKKKILEAVGTVAPKFIEHGSRLQGTCYVVACKDSDTAEWLKTVIGELQIDGAKMEAVPFNEHKKSMGKRFWIFLREKEEIENVLSYIKTQNGIDTANWEIIKNDFVADGQEMGFLVDEESAEKIKQSGYRLFCGMGRIFMKTFDS